MADEQMSEQAEKEAQEAKERFERLQADYNEQKARLEKAEKKAEEQEKRARKAEKEAKGKVDSDDLNEWKQKFEIEHERNEKHEAELARLVGVQKQNTIMQAVSGVSDYAPGMNNIMATVINAQTKIDNGKVVVVDASGQIRLSKATMQPMTVAELRDEIIQTTPSMIRAKADGGTGSAGNDRGDNGSYSEKDLEALPQIERQAIIAKMSKAERKAMLEKSIQ